MTTPDKRRALGKGLESLLPAARTSVAASAPAAAGDGGVKEIALDKIDRNPYQTRTVFRDAALNELAASIKSSGVVQPVIVRPTPDGRFQLIAGERRWLASQRAGRTTVPAIVRQVSNETALEFTIIENLQREDLNCMEQARAYDRLGREFGLTQEQMATKTGKDRASVANYLRLLKLPDEVQALLQSGGLSFGHARALLALDSPESMSKSAAHIVKKALSVRQTEEMVRELMHPTEKPVVQRKVDPNVREVQRELERLLGMKVEIKERRGKGKIMIKFSSIEEFEQVHAAIKKGAR